LKIVLIYFIPASLLGLVELKVILPEAGGRFQKSKLSKIFIGQQCYFTIKSKL